MNCSYTEDFDVAHFEYDDVTDTYICPCGKKLKFTSYRKSEGTKRYQAKKSDCNSCPCRQSCCSNPSHPRRITRHLHEAMRQKQSMNIGTPEYYAAMRLRKIWCEGNFSHQKERHNLKRTRKRGIEKVTEQCLLSACALNLKRLVNYLERNPRRLTILLLSLFFCWRTGFLLWLVDFVNSTETRSRLHYENLTTQRET